MNKKMMIIALAVLALIAIAFAALSMNSVDAQQEAVVLPTPEPVTETVNEPVTGNEELTEGGAAAQDEAGDEGMIEIMELGGEIAEIADGYIVIRDSVLGDVQVNLGDDTLYDGADLEELAVGQFIQVMYDGKMTRSLPPQVFALKVGLYPVSGTVKEVGEGSVILETQESGEVIVFLPEGAPQLAAGDSVIAYTNGAMTMSLPAQTTAIGVVKN